MPEELVVITLAAIFCGSGVILYTVSQIVKYLHARSGTRLGRGESSLTTGELERLLRSVVEEANQSLLERVNSVEDRLDALPRQIGMGAAEKIEASPNSPGDLAEEQDVP
jgi:hypothetical protein